MKLRLSTLALGAVVATAIVAPVGQSLAQQTPDEIRVDAIELRDADFVTAVRTLMAKTGLSIVFSGATDGYGKVTLKLDNVSADEAVKYLCESANAYFKRDESGVYIISRTKPEPPAKTGEAAPPRPKLVSKKIKLMAADPEQIFRQLMGGDPFDPTKTFDKINEFRRRNDPTSKISGGNTLFFPGLPQSQPMTPQQYVQPRGDTSNDILLPGEGANQFSPGRGGQPGVAGGGGQGGGGGGLGGQGGGGGVGQGGGISLQGSPLLGPSIDFITFDPNDNSIFVHGSEEDIAELQRFINFFDIAPRQVLIKLEFIQTGEGLARSLGFDVNYSRGPVFLGTTPGSFARSSDPIVLSWATGNLSARMRMSIERSGGRTVNAPVIRTLNNQPATIQSTVTTTLFLNNVLVTPTGTVTVPQVQNVSVTTGIAVNPRINNDGTITMALAPQVSDFGQIRRDPSTGREFPDQLFQGLNVVARVRNGETIVLGGLTRKIDASTGSRFPILGDLPIIGQFFRFSRTDKNTSELLIFVTPTVIDDEENNGLGPN